MRPDVPPARPHVRPGFAGSSMIGMETILLWSDRFGNLDMPEFKLV
jgi:hypothetical protein